ncbi:uncharacterized protein MELLADRAFT_90638 [Melampsora larici-populina 98AG31]|uniref:Uncharacterized protein n=1 Tax=Melampsora larici-populina (strain 98AG31 / pathotype 3-4-7) TaxID=747676 RepID=F4RXL9_MELLP|nr:uncharacterized protein MELLADRAFT_90638 [Melampsora larici-populina 98AG31]EGG02746.1 hypothetical protein MELLADRAFT_90638 [Melampsora larici-populina 98AG31]
MSSFQNRSFSNLSQELSGLGPGSNSPQTLVNATSLRTFNNFGTLRDDASQDFDSVNPRASRPLGPGELLVFDELVTKAGLDVVHRDLALTNSESQGPFRHLVMSVRMAKMLFEMTKLTDHLLKMSDQVGGLLDKVEAGLVKVNRLSMKGGSTSDKVESITEHLETLTELVQSAPTVQPNANGNASVWVNNAAAPTPVAWTCSPELRNAIVNAAHRFIIMDNLESYTALETPERVWLTCSLFNCIKTAVWQNGTVSQFLPPQVNGVSEVSSTRTYNTEIKNVAKHAREHLHLLANSTVQLLTGVYNPKNPVIHGTVPNLRALLHRIAIKFGQAADHADMDSVWASTSVLTRCRIAYLKLCAFSRKDAAPVPFGPLLTTSSTKCVNEGGNIQPHITENVSFRLPWEADVNAGILGVPDEDMDQ